MGNFESVTSEKAAVNIDLDLQSTQSYNGAGLKGEIDLRKTFIYDENWLQQQHQELLKLYNIFFMI